MYIKILTTHKPKISTTYLASCYIHNNVTTYLASCYIHNNVTNIPQERLIGLDRHNTYIASSLSKNIDHIPLHVFQKISTNWCSIIQKYGQLTNGAFFWTLHVFQKDWQIDSALFENIDKPPTMSLIPHVFQTKNIPQKNIWSHISRLQSSPSPEYWAFESIFMYVITSWTYQISFYSIHFFSMTTPEQFARKSQISSCYIHNKLAKYPNILTFAEIGFYIWSMFGNSVKTACYIHNNVMYLPFFRS